MNGLNSWMRVDDTGVLFVEVSKVHCTQAKAEAGVTWGLPV